MIKIVLISLLVSFSFIVSSPAEEAMDLKALTQQCVLAAQNYQPIKPEDVYKELQTVKYEGWSGDAYNFELIHPVVLTIMFDDNKNTGFFLFPDNLQKKYRVVANFDVFGNCELVEIVRQGYINRIFHGRMTDGVIKGVWEKGDGKKAYAFYVKAIN